MKGQVNIHPCPEPEPLAPEEEARLWLTLFPENPDFLIIDPDDVLVVDEDIDPNVNADPDPDL